MEYDVALSFAGEDREYVEAVATELKRLGIKVFFDNLDTVDLREMDLYTYLQNIYKKQARYTVIFISRHYTEKLWTKHERRIAIVQALSESKEYILTARFDDVETEGILPITEIIDLRNILPEDIALFITKKAEIKASNTTNIEGNSNVVIQGVFGSQNININSEQSSKIIIKEIDAAFQSYLTHWKTTLENDSDRIDSFCNNNLFFEDIFGTWFRNAMYDCFNVFCQNVNSILITYEKSPISDALKENLIQLLKSYHTRIRPPDISLSKTGEGALVGFLAGSFLPGLGNIIGGTVGGMGGWVLTLFETRKKARSYILTGINDAVNMVSNQKTSLLELFIKEYNLVD